MNKLFWIPWLTIHLLVAQKNLQLALTPPMGWNSWNDFGCNVSEKLIKETADAMVASGMKDAGYVYVNIDDCWHGERDSLGFIHPDPQKFPSGMKALVDYVHAKGLKLGIYSDAGTKTCGGKPGSRGYEYQDALTYAKWGIDYLKYDWCNTDGLLAKEAYKTMRDAIAHTKRPMIYSICEWGDNKPWDWAKDIGHLWRTTGDIYHCWNCEFGHGTWTSWGVLRILDMQKDLRKHAGPGHWNDPDMMEVGNGMSLAEDRSHFSLWAMLAAPLIAGNDIRHMSKDVKEILTNKEIIAVDQDSLGIQCFKLWGNGVVEVYAKPLKNNELAICFLNRGEKVEAVNFDWAENEIFDWGISNQTYPFKTKTFKIRDLWAHKDMGTTATAFKTNVNPHDVVMLRLK